MMNCQETGSRIWYSTSGNPSRKYAHTWEMVETSSGHRVGINTSRANNLVREAVEGGKIAELQGYLGIRAEVPYGDERSRIDLLLTGNPSADDCYVEIKNVSLGVGDGMGVFPDAVTTRGHKHLRELMKIASEGYRALLLFCVQHSGIDRVGPADAIDPEYGRLLRLAEANGVELLAYEISLSPAEFVLSRKLPVVLPAV
jgi:sugar fermentation stimulation protein A